MIQRMPEEHENSVQSGDDPQETVGGGCTAITWGDWACTRLNGEDPRTTVSIAPVAQRNESSRSITDRSYVRFVPGAQSLQCLSGESGGL